MSTIKFLVSCVCSAFESTGIGSRVLEIGKFTDALEKAVQSHDPAADRVPGQHNVTLGLELYPAVSAGVGKRTKNPGDFVLRENRGQVNTYLRRELAAPVEGLEVSVYTREAYLADPDLQLPHMKSELDRVTGSDATYVIVSVRASAGPASPLTPDRFLKNLAGGNKEAKLWSADEIRSMAKEVSDYYAQWCVVAD